MSLLAPLRRRAAVAALTVTVLLLPLASGAGAAEAAPVAVSKSSAEGAELRTAKAVKAELKIKRLKRKRAHSPKAFAHLRVERKYGWSHRQWTCLNRLWKRESGWRTKARNRSSGAYGIPQALPGRKMGKGWRTNPRTQVRWGLSYIDERWGNPCKAERHQKRRGWY